MFPHLFSLDEAQLNWGDQLTGDLEAHTPQWSEVLHWVEIIGQVWLMNTETSRQFSLKWDKK